MDAIKDGDGCDDNNILINCVRILGDEKLHLTGSLTYVIFCKMEK